MGVDEVFPARFALIQAVDEGIPSINEIIEVVEIFHLQDRNAEVVSSKLFPIAFDLVGLLFPFRRIEGDG